MEIKIYTDGSSRGNPGPGGFGSILIYNEHRKEISKGFRLTTNNRMELLAVISGLELIKNKNIPITIYSDSQYVVKSIEEGWLKKWISNNFKGRTNKDLWLRYIQASKDMNIKMKWVKGHAENPFNNRCDELATAAADGNILNVDTEYEKQNK